MSKRERRLSNVEARGLSRQELIGELRACFLEKAEPAGDLTAQEEMCLERLAEDIEGNVYTWSQVEGAMIPGWRPCDDILSQGG